MRSTSPANHRGLALCVLIFGVVLSIRALCAQSPGASPVPAPEPPRLSTQFKVTAGGAAVPVYPVQVFGLSVEQREHQGGVFEPSETTEAAFAGFDLPVAAKVTVSCPENVQSARILPSSLGITPRVSGTTVTFTVSKPGQLTLEVNGNWLNSLHLFADPVEPGIPNASDPNVIYFGPGVHQIQSMEVTSGQTVYVARGAVVYGNVDGDAAPHRPIFYLHGSNITLRGRGIIDGSRCGAHTRGIVGVTGTNISVEGVTLRDSSGFTLPVRRSDHVHIDNVKIFGWRGNSDGMDLCNSRSVDVRNCFLRTFDDLIVLKTDKGQGELRDVTVKNCVLWNEFAHALSLGAELREPMANVLFSDCDVIHDKGREWLLRVYNCDSASVQNVVFDKIRIEEARRLMSVWIGQAVWSKEAERGHIDHVIFRDIRSAAPSRPGPYGSLVGVDAAHRVNDVQFQGVVVNGQPLKQSDVAQNPFVSRVGVQP